MVATVINYCTNDYRFLAACLSEARKFSKEIIVPVCDHFFDGTPENKLLLEHSYAAHPDVKFIEFALEREGYALYSPFNESDPDWIHYMHSTARYLGYQFISPEIEYVLFLDVDEIVDAKKMNAWLKQYPFQGFNAVRYTSYFYFREARFQATKIMRNGLLIKRLNFDENLLLDSTERKGTFDAIPGLKLEDTPALDGRPLVHHYSWVKTRQEMHKKVQTWGHHLDKNWSVLVEEELKNPFALKDKFWGFDYKLVRPFIDPLEVLIPSALLKSSSVNVIKINRKKNFASKLLKELE